VTDAIAGLGARHHAHVQGASRLRHDFGELVAAARRAGILTASSPTA
jgi:hypothetical protein